MRGSNLGACRWQDRRCCRCTGHLAVCLIGAIRAQRLTSGQTPGRTARTSITARNQPLSATNLPKQQCSSLPIAIGHRAAFPRTAF